MNGATVEPGTRVAESRARRLRAALVSLSVLALAACSRQPTQPGVGQPLVRHLLFTSADRAVVGETLYVTSEVINDGPGTIWFWNGPGVMPFDLAMGDTQRVYTSDPTIVPAAPVVLDSVVAGGRSVAILAFTGPLWDSLGTRFDAPDGRYVARRAFTYSRNRDARDPITLPRGVDFRWVVP